MKKGDDITEQITYSRQEAEALVTRWADTVLRIGYTWTCSAQDAQDISQTILLKLLTSPRRFTAPEQERAWVIRVAVTAARTGKSPPGTGGGCRWRTRRSRRSICRS